MFTNILTDTYFFDGFDPPSSVSGMFPCSLWRALTDGQSPEPLLTQLDTRIKRKRDHKRLVKSVNSVTSHFLTFSCKFQARARFIFDYVQLCSTLAIYSFLMLGEFEIVYIKCGRAKMRASHNGLREFLCMCC